MKDSQVHEVRKESFGLLIKKIHLRIEKELQRRLGEMGPGLNLRTFGIIMLLLEEDGLTQKELGTRAEVPGYATTRSLDELEKHGLVHRRAHPTSRRSHLIYLTDAGRQHSSKLPAMIADLNDEFLSACSKSEREVLRSALSTILKSHPKL